jgi:hypothetical protein
MDYDLWCPCFDQAAGEDTNVKTGTANTGTTTAPQPTIDDFVGVIRAVFSSM